MRKYLLPAIVCAAVGALILLLVQRSEPQRGTHQVETEETKYTPVTKTSLIGPPADTPTRLDEHKALREMQRTLAEGNLGDAMYFRQQVCSDLDTILANAKLTKDLLDTIRKYGIESDDLKRRDVVLPILRVLDHPEATTLIGEEYYRAKNEQEQMMLLEAMAKPFHDPRQASIWAVDKALNSPSEENREVALTTIVHFAVDNEVIISTGMQIYNASTDLRQRQKALMAIAERGDQSASARDFTRRILKNPQPDDILTIMAYLPTWGDDNDAARLEQLAVEFPAMGDALRDQARVVRRARAADRNPKSPLRDDMEERAREDEERNRQAEEERKRLEEAGG